MEKLFKKLGFGIIAIVLFGSFTGVALADTPPLAVQFQNSPLFSEANFLPGNEVVRTVGVANNSSTGQNVIVEAINVADSGGLGDKLNLLIKEGGVTRYTGSLGQFLRAGEVSLSALTGGASTTYSFGVTFDSGANNDTQNAALGFDLCVGFSGGDKHCGNTVIDGEGGGPGGGGGTGGAGDTLFGAGGGGSGYTTTSLIIFNVQALGVYNVDQSGSAVITWDTNLLATSQVVYGLASGGPYTLVLIPPSFGYPINTTEDPAKIIHHLVLLSGLTPGQTYVYRVISRASPPTVSYEYRFTIPLPGQVGDNVFINGNTGNLFGQVAGAATVPVGEIGTASATATATTGPTGNNNLAAAFLAGFGDILSGCTLIALLILLAIYLIWRLWLRRKYEEDGLPEKDIGDRFYLFFAGSSLLAILISMALNKYCPLPVFITALVVSLVLYIFRKLTS